MEIDRAALVTSDQENKSSAAAEVADRGVERAEKFLRPTSWKVFLFAGGSGRPSETK